jgi:hypothetical protein
MPQNLNFVGQNLYFLLHLCCSLNRGLNEVHLENEMSLAIERKKKREALLYVFVSLILNDLIQHRKLF